MPPSGGGKRKRVDRNQPEDDHGRPSPHRPGNLDLARSPHHGYSDRGRGDRRSSRGARAPFKSDSPVETRSAIPSKPTPASSTSIPAAQTRTETPEIVSAEPMPDKAFHSSLITVDVVEAWETTGKENVAQKITKAVEDGDDVLLTTILQELLYGSCTQSISAKEAGALVRQATTPRAMEVIPLTAQGEILDATSIFFEDNQYLPAEPIAEFLAATGITEEAMRHGLDQPLLAKLGLISARFKQMSIRKTTNILYRQANFNLMREESEGFAKLITELFTTSGNEPPTDEVIHNTVEKIKAMIGAFDLDVGRSLDVVLDVFGSVLVRHFRFLVKLLRASPWWPSAQEDTSDSAGLPGWANSSAAAAHAIDHLHHRDKEAAFEKDQEFWVEARAKGVLAFLQIGRTPATTQALERAQASTDDGINSQWIRDTKTFPPRGNRDAAQLLGFKLRFYSSSAARDAGDILPDNLIHLSALLIKIGFISLNDLYPHIWRFDEEMGSLKEQKEKEKEERDRAARPGAGTRNALAMAGALADDTLPVPTTRLRDSATRSSTPAKDTDPQKPTTKDAINEPNDQKVTLLKSLLAVGALPEALFIIGRFPWIIDLYPEVPEYIHRILHHCLHCVYEKVQPLQPRDSLRSLRPTSEADASIATKGQLRLVETAKKKTLKWANLDKDDSGDGTDYRFYWDDWNDNIPVCQTVDDVFTLCDSLLPLVGVKIGQDPSLVLKLTRIGKSDLLRDSSAPNKHRWLHLIKSVLLPSLSLTKSNAGVVNEVFDLMSLYPITTRYIMYLEWSSGRTSRMPDVKSAFDQARAETKDILKRISKTNVKPMARALARVAYANPHVVITTALQQIEVYDSIAEVFVEGARYFTDLGYDVLTWAMISSMSRAGRSRTQEGGMFTSKWLSALSQFAGKIYKRYSMMKPGPILQYVAYQLDQGNWTDLKMLEQVIAAMAGIATDTSFNDAQLLAMGGGALLQSQTILQLLDRRNDSKTTSRRLIKALHDYGLTAKLLISMAQQRQSCVFEEAEVPLKAIGNTFDETNRVMTQYLDLLRANLSSEDFQSSIPDIAELLIDYQLPPEVAFWIARPVISKQIAETQKIDTDVQRENGVKSVNEDVEMGASEEEDGEEVEVDDVSKTLATPPPEHETNGDIDNGVVPTSRNAEQWHPVLQPLMTSLSDHLPSDVIEHVGVGFYVTFWQLSLYDIYVPNKAYEDEMSRQKKKIAAIRADRSNISAQGARARETNVKQHQNIIDELLKELGQHMKSNGESRARLNREKDQWFANKQRLSEQISTALMEYCFLPRVLCSPQDAFFCYKFLKFLHLNGTPSFRTLGFYDILLKSNRLTSLFFMCTSKESDNLGRFLRDLLQDLARWHKDKTIYEREAFGSKKNLIGFAMKVENGKPQVFLDYEPFRRILFKWHSNIHAALNKCLTSSEYMHVRNAISILRAISPVFPAVKYHGIELQKAVDKLRNSDREDLKVASAALLGALSRREKEWLMPAAFRQGQDRGDQQPKTNGPKQIDPTADTTDAVKSALVAKPVGPSTSESTRQLKIEPKPVVESASRPSSKPPPADASHGSSRHGVVVPSHPSNRPDRRPGRPIEQDRSQVTSRNLSPAPRSTTPANTSSRSESDSRNGYRESSRLSNRQVPQDTGRTDTRSAYAHHGPPDRNLELPSEPSHRYPRDDRLARREYEARHTHEERRQTGRDMRTEREVRPEREHYRTSERDSRPSDREHGRLQPDIDRKRPDLVDDRRPTSAVSGRSAVTQPVAAGINPERAALINSSESRPNISIRGQAQEKPRESRQSSPPRRSDDVRYSERIERDERPQRRPEAPTRHTPVNPRSTPSNNFSRDSRHQPIDMQHGRLEPESPQRISQSDRANDMEVPSGPRQRGLPPARSRGGQSAGSPTERPTPTGPSRHFRNGSIQESPIPKPQDTTGVHPDRMNQIAPDAARAPQTQPPSGPRTAPSGPATAIPSPAPRGAPTGPQIDPNRGRRNPIDTLNNALAQAQGAAGRGKGGRQNTSSLPPQVPPSGPASRAPFSPVDPTNPNGMPVQPRPTSSRRESLKAGKVEDESRMDRSRPEPRDERRFDESRRNERRDDQAREPRGPRSSIGDDLPPRKHTREDSTHYGGYGRGGSRNVSESKRPRRGG